MSRNIAVACTSCLLGLSALLSVSGVAAQPVVGTPVTATSQAEVPALGYVSPIDGYKAYEPQSIQSWKEANDTVGRIGGWRVYSRETQQDKTLTPNQPTTGDNAPHSNHHGEKK